MTNKEILSRIDHTLLKQFATWEEIKVICDDAIEYKTASVCIPPSYVKKIKETYGEQLNICTVIGFPLGYNTTAVKVFEAVDACSLVALAVTSSFPTSARKVSMLLPCLGNQCITSLWLLAMPRVAPSLWQMMFFSVSPYCLQR